MTTLSGTIWEHLRAKINKSSECWIWTGAIEKTGYGKISLSGTSILAHRLSYLLTHGSIPDNRMVCHHCDVRACVNPNHLFLGSSAENAQDRKVKNQRIEKERSPHKSRILRLIPPTTHRTLSVDQVRHIRNAYLTSSITQTELAEYYKISQSTISKILAGTLYRDPTYFPPRKLYADERLSEELLAPA